MTRRTGFRRWVMVAGAGALALSGTACRDEPPPPAYPENLGDGGRILPLMPPTQYNLPDKLVSGRAELRTIDFDRIGHAADAPPPAAFTEESPDDALTDVKGLASPLIPSLDQPVTITTPDFPETATAVQALLTSFNQIAAEGDTTKLLDFFMEDQRPDMAEVYRLARSLLDKIDRLVRAFDKINPQMAQTVKAGVAAGMGGDRNAAYMIRLATLTPESETRASGTLGGAHAGEKIGFRRIDDRWYIDLNAAKLLADGQKVVQQFEPLDAISEGLENGTMDLATAQQRLMAMVARLRPPGASTPPSDGGNP